MSESAFQNVVEWTRFWSRNEDAAERDVSTGVEFLDKFCEIKAGNVLEVYGESGAGKTE